MKKLKLLLYTGLVLLITGIIIRVTNGPGLLSNILIYSGITLKVSYLLTIIFKGWFKPGIELLFLLVGLSLVIGGGRLRVFDYHPYLITTMISLGVIFKMLFIVFLFRKLRRKKA
ncbi:hypothetical protein ACT3CD_07530 [Geofilum sp. OHC36d9]|uniref:hypothetical protein n=1 Tax=Geofilum sp. OHC36d9 TaxID=3458413 RepID=UPI0040336312